MRKKAPGPAVSGARKYGQLAAAHSQTGAGLPRKALIIRA